MLQNQFPQIHQTCALCGAFEQVENLNFKSPHLLNDCPMKQNKAQLVSTLQKINTSLASQHSTNLSLLASNSISNRLLLRKSLIEFHLAQIGTFIAFDAFDIVEFKFNSRLGVAASSTSTTNADDNTNATTNNNTTTTTTNSNEFFEQTLKRKRFNDDFNDDFSDTFEPQIMLHEYQSENVDWINFLPSNTPIHGISSSLKDPTSIIASDFDHDFMLGDSCDIATTLAATTTTVANTTTLNDPNFALNSFGDYNSTPTGTNLTIATSPQVATPNPTICDITNTTHITADTDFDELAMRYGNDYYTFLKSLSTKHFSILDDDDDDCVLDPIEEEPLEEYIDSEISADELEALCEGGEENYNSSVQYFNNFNVNDGERTMIDGKVVPFDFQSLLGSQLNQCFQIIVQNLLVSRELGPIGSTNTTTYWQSSLETFMSEYSDSEVIPDLKMVPLILSQMNSLPVCPHFSSKIRKRQGRKSSVSSISIPSHVQTLLKRFETFNPSLFPSISSSVGAAKVNNRRFLESEDNLLLIALWHYSDAQWKEIKKGFLPHRTEKALQQRYKNLTCRRSKNEKFQHYKFMSQRPLSFSQKQLIKEELSRDPSVIYRVSKEVARPPGIVRIAYLMLNDSLSKQKKEYTEIRNIARRIASQTDDFTEQDEYEDEDGSIEGDINDSNDDVDEDDDEYES